ncbi:GGDEF domain-containing protein [Deinococcus sedimenti]|uniref:GGDEF domain-containing protein n=1 Tax=Deinococcus sedimenti TaxID=1867090 RepID=A0ABQ2S8H6_9DEIO|nr:GGDEF domain-containing protein [Deinococcus sedimenti]GGS07213.1 GGDEF domain-containing protein [Deinococcus sedimenti]
MPPALNPLLILAASVSVTVLIVALSTLVLAWWRPSYPGWRSWAAGHTLVVLGMLIGTYRPPGLDRTSILLGNALLMIGAALFVGAYYRFARRSVPVALTAGLSASIPVVLGLLHWFTAAHDNITARVLLVSIYLTVCVGALVTLIVQQMRQERHLRGTYALHLWLFGSVFILTVPRSVTLAPGSHPDLTYAFTAPNVLMFTGVLVLSVGGAFAFWLLHDDRRRADMQALQDHLSDLAFRDELTGVLNRRGLEGAYARWRARPDSRVATLVVLDVDRFKDLNDRHGHAAGDAQLAALGGLLNRVAQRDDVAGRTGGDEFTMLLTGEAPDVEAQLSRLTETLGRRSELLSCSVSVGWTTVSPHDTWSDGLSRADEAMYVRKARRANPTIKFTPGVAR